MVVLFKSREAVLILSWWMLFLSIAFWVDPLNLRLCCSDSVHWLVLYGMDVKNLKQIFRERQKACSRSQADSFRDYTFSHLLEEVETAAAVIERLCLICDQQLLKFSVLKAQKIFDSSYYHSGERAFLIFSQWYSDYLDWFDGSTGHLSTFGSASITLLTTVLVLSWKILVHVILNLIIQTIGDFMPPSGWRSVYMLHLHFCFFTNSTLWVIVVFSLYDLFKLKAETSWSLRTCLFLVLDAILLNILLSVLNMINVIYHLSSVNGVVFPLTPGQHNWMFCGCQKIPPSAHLIWWKCCSGPLFWLIF